MKLKNGIKGIHWKNRIKIFYENESIYVSPCLSSSIARYMECELGKIEYDKKNAMYNIYLLEKPFRIPKTESEIVKIIDLLKYEDDFEFKYEDVFHLEEYEIDKTYGFRIYFENELKDSSDCISTKILPYKNCEVERVTISNKKYNFHLKEFPLFITSPSFSTL